MFTRLAIQKKRDNVDKNKNEKKKAEKCFLDFSFFHCTVNSVSIVQLIWIKNKTQVLVFKIVSIHIYWVSEKKIKQVYC